MKETKERKSQTIQSYEIIAFIADMLSNRLENKGIEDKEANKIASEIVEDLRFCFGGQMVYIPNGKLLKSNEITEQIWQQFSQGMSIKEIAQFHKYSIQSIYEHLAKKRTMIRNQKS